ncbi:MAG TPA: RNA polymerase sigma factor [Vicinamibacterales bacterium]
MRVAETAVQRQEPDSDDRPLVAACLACNREAIEQLVATHHPAIARLAQALLGREEVDDVCQDVYLRVFKELGRFEHRSRLGTWIYRIALNVIRNRQRSARRRHFDSHVTFDELKPRDHFEFLTDAATPASVSESRERARHLRRTILALAPLQRRALMLWTYCDSTHATIARSTALSLTDVERTLRLAKKSVRRQFIRLTATIEIRNRNSFDVTRQ